MDSITELIIAIREQGWEVSRTAHGYQCRGCLYAALNGANLISRDSYTRSTTGYTSGGHEATITRKDA